MNQWCEKVLALESTPNKDGSVDERIYYTESAPNTENVVKVLQPEKFFSEDAKKDLKVGDQFEICPGANQFTQDISSLIELSKGAALIIDYGEDHAFSNSFRVSFSDHFEKFFIRV
jgi:SAM-dependent MidA family methyltransferase